MFCGLYGKRLMFDFYIFQEQNYFNKKGPQRFDFIDKVHHMCLDSTLSELQELKSAISTTPSDGQKLIEEAVCTFCFLLRRSDRH